MLVDQSKKANSPLKGHERTVQYLQRLGKSTFRKGGESAPVQTTGSPSVSVSAWLLPSFHACVHSISFLQMA